MLQDPGVKPPDEIRTHSFCRTTMDRLQKSNVNSDEVLKCPRCDSMNTKFCYYNNYSLSQPRHFCKNCRRYWTKGGALRNVPIGGGCRKNKRIKQRTVDPSSLISLDETTSNMLANIKTGNCTSSLLSSFSGPSSSAFVNLSNDGHGYGAAFSRIQESLRLGDQPEVAPSDPGVYRLGIRSGQLTTELLNASCSQSSPITSLPLFDTNLLGVSYPACTVKTDEGILYNGSDLRSFFETPTIQMAGATTMLASLEGHLPAYSTQPCESFSGAGIEDHFKLRQKQLAMQLGNDAQSGDRARIGPFFQDENSQEKLGRIQGRGIPPPLGDGRFFSDWQGMPDTETTGQSNVWTNTGWADLHMLSNGTAVGTL